MTLEHRRAWLFIAGLAVVAVASAVYVLIGHYPTPAGAQITYTTSSPSLVKARHAWFDAQGLRPRSARRTPIDHSGRGRVMVNGAGLSGPRRPPPTTEFYPPFVNRCEE
ncbi:hypothetical protein GCM10022226_45690 [Sphaerisporangium flaviroseum]|uniref:Uncharacterized protein n=1 Tax=Sphaerisporangium flaviroseum TaxID=509199 RepID=A0ABP7IJM3_9ACTN